MTSAMAVEELLLGNTAEASRLYFAQNPMCLGDNANISDRTDINSRRSQT
jgi:hypothetical protein